MLHEATQIFTLGYIGLHEVTQRLYTGLNEATKGYMRLHRVTQGYKLGYLRLHDTTQSYMRLHKVAYETDRVT